VNVGDLYAEAARTAAEFYRFDLDEPEWALLSNHALMFGTFVRETGEPGRDEYDVIWRGMMLGVIYDRSAARIVTFRPPKSFAEKYAERTGHLPFAGTKEPRPDVDRFPGSGPRPPAPRRPIPEPRGIPEGVRDPSGPQTEADSVDVPDPPAPPPAPDPEEIPEETDPLSPYYKGAVDIDGRFGYPETGSPAIHAGEKQTGGTQTMVQQAPKKLFTFKRAEKRQGKLRVAFTGPSGSGKTLSALLIAQGMGKRIFVIDTENYSASDYADRAEFDVAVITPPYTVAKYLAAMEQAEEEGADVIIVDSLSHAWAGDGGLLEQKDILDAAGGGKAFQNWAKISPLHARLVSKILQNQRHLICTLRAKAKHQIVEKPGGGTKVEKLGLDPVFREGIEYEFTVAFDLLMSHHAQTSKDRTSLFDGQLVIPTLEMGAKLLAWRMEGREAVDGDVPVVQAPEESDAAPATRAPSPGNGKTETKTADDRPSDGEYDTLRTIGQNLNPKKGIGALAREAGFSMPITGKQARQIIDKYAGTEAGA
jgi:hypothetical protein